MTIFYFLLLVIRMISHLSGLNSISQSTSHVCSLSMSSCNVSASCVVLMLRYRRQERLWAIKSKLTTKLCFMYVGAESDFSEYSSMMFFVK